MARFFMAGSNIAGGPVLITGADAEHAKVLRLKIGDRIIVCDGERTDHHCTVTKITPEAVEAEVVESVPCPAEPNVRAIVLAGLPKQGERSDFVVQKCTEAGVNRIVPVNMPRCVARLSADDEKKRIRWQRIAREAAKQAFRASVPEITPPVSISELPGLLSGHALALVPWEEAQNGTLRTLITPDTHDLAMFIPQTEHIHARQRNRVAEVERQLPTRGDAVSEHLLLRVLVFIRHGSGSYRCPW